MKRKGIRRGISHFTAVAALVIVVIIVLFLFGFVSYWSEFLFVTIVGVGVIYAWYGSTVIRKKPVTGVESLVAAKGEVHSETLSRDGEVSVNGVIWKARLANPNDFPLKKGDAVVVKKVEELVLLVEQSSTLAQII